MTVQEKALEGVIADNLELWQLWEAEMVRSDSNNHKSVALSSYYEGRYDMALQMRTLIKGDDS